MHTFLSLLPSTTLLSPFLFYFSLLTAIHPYSTKSLSSLIHFYGQLSNSHLPVIITFDYTTLTFTHRQQGTLNFLHLRVAHFTPFKTSDLLRNAIELLYRSIKLSSIFLPASVSRELRFRRRRAGKELRAHPLYSQPVYIYTYSQRALFCSAFYFLLLSFFLSVKKNRLLWCEQKVAMCGRK